MIPSHSPQTVVNQPGIASAIAERRARADIPCKRRATWRGPIHTRAVPQLLDRRSTLLRRRAACRSDTAPPRSDDGSPTNLGVWTDSLGAHRLSPTARPQKCASPDATDAPPQKSEFLQNGHTMSRCDRAGTERLAPRATPPHIADGHSWTTDRGLSVSREPTQGLHFVNRENAR